MSDLPTRLRELYVSHGLNYVQEAANEIERLQAERDALLDAMGKLRQWVKAYPIAVFPEPDFKAVADALKASGISLDSVSASNMRYVITQVGEIIDAAMKEGRDETP